MKRLKERFDNLLTRDQADKVIMWLVILTGLLTALHFIIRH
jgi:hypothetical protein